MKEPINTRGHRVSLITAAIAGVLFGVGLVLSGMTQPAAVIGFLDPLSGWDPRLAFVMGGAVLVYATAFRSIGRYRRKPWFDDSFHLPTRRDIDVRLVVGAALFGIGWGLGGLCPGPGLVAAASGSSGAITFVIAMVVGMFLHRLVSRR